MDLSTLDRQDQGQIYQVCTNFSIEPSDPIVGVLLAIKGMEKEVIKKISEERKGHENLIIESKKVSSELKDQLLIQKRVAEVIDEQGKFFQKVRSGFLVFFLGALIGGGVLGATALYAFNPTLKAFRGTDLKVTKEKGVKYLRINDQKIIGATRNGNEVTLQIAREE